LHGKIKRKLNLRKSKWHHFCIWGDALLKSSCVEQLCNLRILQAYYFVDHYQFLHFLSSSKEKKQAILNKAIGFSN